MGEYLHKCFCAYCYCMYRLSPPGVSSLIALHALFQLYSYHFSQAEKSLYWVFNYLILQYWNIIKHSYNDCFICFLTGNLADDKFIDAVVLNLFLLFNKHLLMGFDFTYESFTFKELRSYMAPVICQWKECEEDGVTKGQKTDFWEPLLICI